MQSLRRAVALAAVLCCVLLAPGASGFAQRQVTSEQPLSERTTIAAPAVIGASGIVQGVEFLENSLEYYREVLGFEMIGEASEMPIFDIKIQALTNHGGALYRTALLEIPDSTFNLQLFEVTNGQPRTRSSPRQLTARPTDRGGVVLGYEVPDIVRTFTSIETSGQATVINVGGKPVGKTLFVRNRDGLVTRFSQRGETERSTELNANPASIALTPGDVDATLRFYRDLLGFDLKTGDWEASKDVMNALGAEVGMVRRSQGYVPGTNIHFEIDEYSGIPQRRAYYYYNSIPGAVSLQLVVRDIDEIVNVLRASQVRIVTSGQQPVTLDGERTVLVRDPDGVFIQLIEREEG